MPLTGSGQLNRKNDERVMIIKVIIDLTVDGATMHELYYEWNRLSADCVGANSVNMFKNKTDIYLRRAG